MVSKNTSLATKQHLYSDVRDTLQTGDLIATRTTKIETFFDFVLYWYQKLFKRRFSHVGVVLRVGDRIFIVEAVPKVVRMIPLSMYSNFYLIRTGVKDSSRHFHNLTRHLGKPYSLLDLIKGMLNIKGSENDLYCSELALTFYQDIGYFTDVVDEFDEHTSTPDELVDWVLTQSKSEIEFVRIDKGNIHDL